MKLIDYKQEVTIEIYCHFTRRNVFVIIFLKMEKKIIFGYLTLRVCAVILTFGFFVSSKHYVLLLYLTLARFLEFGMVHRFGEHIGLQYIT